MSNITHTSNIKIKELIEITKKRSPEFDIVSNPTPIIFFEGLAK